MVAFVKHRLTPLAYVVVLQEAVLLQLRHQTLGAQQLQKIQTLQRQIRMQTVMISAPISVQLVQHQLHLTQMIVEHVVLRLLETVLKQMQIVATQQVECLQ
jgi:hypothetical protein